jgi:hypothetical protein
VRHKNVKNFENITLIVLQAFVMTNLQTYQIKHALLMNILQMIQRISLSLLSLLPNNA